MDVASRLRQGLSGTYRLERELPGGGMSRVFLAEEIALGRQVVVKVLPPELGAGVSAERFSREIQLAAKLQQANIVPLLSFGVIDGLPYYTMPYVAGQSLRGSLAATGAFSVSRALGVLRDIARALTYAHERGIIHRDIKPENVLLSGDAAVVTDFGIAKAINESVTAGASDGMTQTGTIVGTPAYIAPEQAAGDPATDHRADLYAFGCLAYELFTGRPPFSGLTHQALLASHLSEVPKPIASIVPDIPPHVAQLITRCLEKSPAARPQSGREILQVLDTVQSPITAAERSPSGVKKRYAYAAAGLLAALAIGYIVLRQRTSAAAPFAPHPKAVAVLPFTNSSGDSTDAYFADGMADELIAALGKVPVLSVASRRSAFALKRRSDLDIPTIGKMLHVDAILEGTVRRSGNRLRVTAQLTGTSDGLTLWTDSYEKDTKDVFAVQDDITRSIVNALQLRLGTGQRQVTTNLSAYDDYLRGSYALEQRGNGVTTAVTLLNSAIKKDSTFARAYGKLSEALELLPYFGGVSAASVETRAVEAANRALALDSSDADAHIGLALALGHRFKWAESDRQYEAAIAADTNSAVARTQYGRQLLQEARIPEAMVQLRRAVALDPLSGTQAAWLAHAQAMNGDIKGGIRDGLKVHRSFPYLDLSKSLLGASLVRVGRMSEALQLVTTLPNTLGFRGQACYIVARAGEPSKALALVKKMQELPDTTWLVHTALAYCYLGLNDEHHAMAELEAALRHAEITPKWMSFGDAYYDEVRQDPRFPGLVRGFGLDPALYTPPNRGRPGK